MKYLSPSDLCSHIVPAKAPPWALCSGRSPRGCCKLGMQRTWRVIFTEHLAGCRPGIGVQEGIHHQALLRRGPRLPDPPRAAPGLGLWCWSQARDRPPTHSGRGSEKGHRIRLPPFTVSSLSPRASVTIAVEEDLGRPTTPHPQRFE